MSPLIYFQEVFEMTIVEKAAYLKGLCEGLGVEPDTKEGKLWGALCDLVSDMAHEIEDLQATSLDYADTLDEMADELTYVEEIVCDLDVPEDMFDEDLDDLDFDDDDPADNIFRIVDDEEIEEGEDDEELSYDGIIYDVTCPKCGEEISFDEDTLSEGKITCPECGEILEFDMDSLDE